MKARGLLVVALCALSVAATYGKRPGGSGGGGGGSSTVTTSAPITGDGVNTPIAMPAATTSVSGYANSTDIAALRQGVKLPCVAVATTNITLSGVQTIDGVSVGSGTNLRTLVVGQSTASQNGIYVAGSGAWTRAVDFSASGDVATGTIVSVSGDSTVSHYANSFWQLQTTGTITIGTTGLIFAPMAGCCATGPNVSAGWFPPAEDFLATGTGSMSMNLAALLSSNAFFQQAGSVISAGRPGVAIAFFGSGTGQYANLGVNTIVNLGAGTWNIASSVFCQQVSNSTSRFLLRAASVADNGNWYFTTTYTANEIGISYTDNVDSGDLVAYACKSSTCTFVDTGITFAANTFYDLATNINAAVSSATYSINGATVATITTNLPTTATNFIVQPFAMGQTSSTVPVGSCGIDYFQPSMTLASPR